MSGASAPPIALWVVPVAEFAGVARHVVDVAAHGIPGHRTVVLCPDGALADRLGEQGSAVTTGRFGPEVGLAASVRTLGATVRALRPAIVHSHLAFADIASAATVLPRGTRRFTTEHGIAGDDAVYHRSGLHARMMAAAHHTRLRAFDGAIAVSEATRRAMITKWRPTIPIGVIRNGVDVPSGFARVPAGAGALRVLSLARLAPEKRIDKLIEAFALLRERVPGATLTIAGEGPLRNDLHDLARRRGIGDAVHFPGFVDSERALAEADVVAQLSIWENCSYTLLDARARGLGVVAADVGGNSEIVGPGGLVAADDRVGVADALQRQWERPDPSRPPRSVAQMCGDNASRYRWRVAS